jgi:hypothetical protein
MVVDYIKGGVLGIDDSTTGPCWAVDSWAIRYFWKFGFSWRVVEQWKANQGRWLKKPISNLDIYYTYWELQQWSYLKSLGSHTI